MSDYDKYSRVNKFEKRRKNTKSLSIFIVLGIIALLVLFTVIFFGGGDEDKNDSAASDKDNTPAESGDSPNTKEEPSSDEQSTSEDGNSNAEGDSTTNEDTTNTEEDSDSEQETEQVEPSDDNVMNAYTKDWSPVGTEQAGQHTINYDKGTQDRNEMKKAAAMATQLDEDSLIMWWIERNGNQKVIATVSNHDNTVYYRAYLSWVEDQGWKPTKVEELKENDQEYRFE